MDELNKNLISKITEKLLAERSFDFREYKPSTLERRIKRRMSVVKCETIEDYIKVLDRTPEEYSALVDNLLINVTEFFRDKGAWDTLSSQVLPEIIKSKEKGSQIKVWCAGCATGEEAYSLAISFAEYLADDLSKYDIRIFATDIDENVLAVARQGSYTENSLEKLPKELKQKYFYCDPNCQPLPKIRRMVVFGRHNLVTDAPISHCDLIVCRNVLIYMTSELQNKVLSKFCYSLESEGFLFLGKAESPLSKSKFFRSVDETNRILRKRSSVITSPYDIVAPDSGGSSSFDFEADEFQTWCVINDSIYRDAPVGIIALNTENKIWAVNPQAARTWHINSSIVLGKPLTNSNIPEYLRNLSSWASQARQEKHEFKIEEFRIGDGPNNQSFHSITFSPLLDVRGDAMGVAIVTYDVTALVKLRNELEDTNDRLQMMNETSETTNEELETINEELQASNEEIEAANEEIRASNEELAEKNKQLSIEVKVRKQIEKHLRSSEQKYKNLVENINSGVAVFEVVNNGEDFIFVSINPAAEKIGHVKRSKVIGKSVREIFPGSDESGFTDIFKKAWLTGKLQKMDTTLYKDERIEGWRDTYIYKINTGHLVVIYDDVTERVNMLEALRNSEELYRTLAQNFPNGAVNLFDKKLKYIVSDGELINKDSNMQNSVGKTMWEVWPKEVADIIEPQYREALLGISSTFDVPYNGKFYSVHVVPVKNKDNDVVGGISVTQDITERRKSEEYNLSLHKINDAIGSTLDSSEIMKRVIVEANEAIEAESSCIFALQDDKWIVKHVYKLPEGTIDKAYPLDVLPNANIAVKTKKLIVVNNADVPGITSKAVRKFKVKSFLVVPLLVRGEAIGVLSFQYHTRNVDFDEMQIDFAAKLGTSISLALENARLYQVAQDAAEKELQARKFVQNQFNILQNALMPSALDEFPGYCVSTVYRASTQGQEIGGDFYDIFNIENGKIGILLGDVTGHGLEAAALAASTRSTVRALAYENLSPGNALSKANAVICSSNKSVDSFQLFVTVFLAVLDTDSGEFKYCCAGHPPPAILRSPDKKVDWLSCGQPPVGVFKEINYYEGENHFSADDILVIYTDGISEARNSKNEMMEESGIEQILMSCNIKSCDDVTNKLLKATQKWTNSRLSDDLAIVTIKRDSKK